MSSTYENHYTTLQHLRLIDDHDGRFIAAADALRARKDGSNRPEIAAAADALQAVVDALKVARAELEKLEAADGRMVELEAEIARGITWTPRASDAAEAKVGGFTLEAYCDEGPYWARLTLPDGFQTEPERPDVGPRFENLEDAKTLAVEQLLAEVRS